MYNQIIQSYEKINMIVSLRLAGCYREGWWGGGSRTHLIEMITNDLK